MESVSMIDMNQVGLIDSLLPKGDKEYEFRLEKIKSTQAKKMCRDDLNEEFLKTIELKDEYLDILKKQEKIVGLIRAPYFSKVNTKDTLEEMVDKNAISYNLKSIVQSYEIKESIRYRMVAQFENMITEKECNGEMIKDKM